MRRLKVPPDRPVGYYHCFSRIVDRRFIFETAEKERFTSLMREYEAFCQVRVLTYCVMSNHFHILLEVPRRPEVLPDMDEVLVMLGKLSGHQNVGAVRQQVDLFRKGKDAEGEARLLAKYHARMWDVSAFMKLVKQRFTQWFNVRTDRTGTLWESRFDSVLVDGAGEALLAMSAYIDLNPVRAGLVADPKDYRWSGYGEALAGKKRARLGLQQVVKALLGGTEESITRSLELYRMRVFQTGDERLESLDERGKPARGVLKQEAVMEVLRNKGRLPLAEYVRCRVRYFCDGAVFGSREFVEGIFQAHRDRFGPKRKSGARRVKGVENELYTLRDLQVNVFDEAAGASEA